MDRIRVASLQYYVRPIRDFSEFRDQVRALVDTAGDYGCELLVFPEYFTVQLLTLGDIGRPMTEQLRSLADFVPDFLDLIERAAKKHRIHIAAGTIPVRDPQDPDTIHNVCHFFAPDGTFGEQGKMHMTRFEKEHWKVTTRKGLRIFETAFGRVAIAICYDVEFPEIARAAAHEGATMLIVPSYTDDRQSFLRVRYCAHARTVENQMFVVHSGAVGSLPMVPAVSLNYGQAAILTPSDFPFARDGILAQGIPNQETMVIGELNLRVLRASRRSGTVLPLRDSRTTKYVLDHTKVVPLSTDENAAAATRSRRRISVRLLRESDFPKIRELSTQIYPEIRPWTDEQLRSHLEVFPQGQFVAVDTQLGQLVGSCSGVVIDWDRYEPGQDWNRFTDDGMFTNHDPVNGRTLFAADIMVHPGLQGHGIGKRLYKRGRFDLARQLGLKRVLAGARLRGYHRVSRSMSAEEYVVEVVNGRINDPTLSFQLAQGFHVLAVAGDYFTGDPESEGWAAVIEWLNEEACEPADRDQGDPRFRPER